MKRLLLFLLVSPAFGQTINYEHQNIYTTDQQFQADRYQCVRETQQPVQIADLQAGYYGTSGQVTSVVVPDCALFQQCLANRGYTRLDSGSLWASPLRCFNATYRRFEVR